MDKDKDNKEGCAGSKCARYNRDSEAELFYSSLTDEELDKWIKAVIVGAAAEEGIDYYEECKDEICFKFFLAFEYLEWLNSYGGIE